MFSHFFNNKDYETPLNWVLQTGLEQIMQCNYILKPIKFSGLK